MNKVCVICPCSRPNEIGHVISQFEQQIYPHKELIILVDTPEISAQYAFKYRNHESVYILPTSKGVGNIGIKRNECREYADHDSNIIVHFDSDDYYAYDYITTAVNALISSDCQLVGMSDIIYYNHNNQQLYKWQSQPNKQVFICEATWCYYKNGIPPFPPEKIGEGRHLLGAVNYGSFYCDSFIASIHGRNSSSHLALPLMKRLPNSTGASLLLSGKFGVKPAPFPQS